MRELSHIWFEIQENLFPYLEKELEEPLTEKKKIGKHFGTCQD